MPRKTPPPPLGASLVEHDDDGWYMWVDHDNDPATPPIKVRLGEAADGRLHVQAVTVEGDPVSAAMLRAVPIGRIEAHANAVASIVQRPDPTNAAINPALFSIEGRGRSDDFYAEVAAIYANLVGHTRQPVVRIAAANDVPATTARRWVNEARKRGLLAPARSGKAG